MRIYGRNSVSERLKADARSVKSLLLDKDQELREFERLAKSKGITVRYFNGREFEKISRNIRAQGVIAEVEDFKYSDLEEVLSQHTERPPGILFLDNLNDPQNLGNILRTAACFGRFVIVLPKHDSVEITEAVLRIASGAENYVPIVQATNLSAVISYAKKQGYWIAGAVVEGGEPLGRARLSFPLGVVIGSEAKGIRQGLLKQLDFSFSIPMRGARLSFNVATAAAIFCYEASRQRGL